MKKLVSLTVIGLASAMSFGQLFNATNVWTGDVNTKATTGTNSDAFDLAYDNTVTYSGSGQSLGLVGAVGSSQSTRMRADDLTVAAGQAGKGVTTITFSTTNFNTTAVSAAPVLCFWDDNAGVPGNLLTAIGIVPLSLNASATQLWTLGAPTSGTWFTLPASGKLWAGLSFNDNGGTTGITVTQLGNVGWGIFNPVAVGSSTDIQFRGTNSGPSNVSNPAGGLTNFGGNPVANFGWKLETVPEPASMAAIGLGIAGLLARRKRK